jgi:hypothetical protein
MGNIKDGEFFTLTKQKQQRQRVLMKNSVSTSTDHSILDQDYQCKELLNATVLTTSGSRDGETMLKPSNGTLMRSPRPSKTTTGSHTHLKSKETVDHLMQDALVLIQDGGNSSDLMEPSLETSRTIRF